MQDQALTERILKRGHAVADERKPSIVTPINTVHYPALAPAPASLYDFLKNYARTGIVAHGRPTSWAIGLGVCTAAGTAALAPLLHWLIRTANIPIVWDWHLLLLVLLLGRPLATVAHVGAAAGLVSRVVDNALVKQRLLSTVIILTRDVPLVFLLFGAALWGGGRDGAIAGAIMLAGLPMAWLIDRLSRKRKSPVARRLARARREAATDIPLLLIVGALFGLKATGYQLSLTGSANIAVCVLLLRAPLRRLARVLDGRA